MVGGGALLAGLDTLLESTDRAAGGPSPKRRSLTVALGAGQALEELDTLKPSKRSTAGRLAKTSRAAPSGGLRTRAAASMATPTQR